MTGKTVAGTTGHNAECRAGIHNGTSHLIHRTVATYRNNNVCADFCCMARYLRSMSRTLGERYAVIKLLFVKYILYDMGNAVFLRGT